MTIKQNLKEGERKMHIDDWGETSQAERIAGRKSQKRAMLGVFLEEKSRVNEGESSSREGEKRRGEGQISKGLKATLTILLHLK